MLIDFFLILIALAILFGGAEAFVRGSASLALHLGIPPLIVGLTFMAYGTSSPELLTSLTAALDHKGDLVAGNVIGANIFNVTVILGVAALLYPMKVTSRMVKVDVPIMLLVMVMAVVVFLDGHLDRFESILLLSSGVVYTVFNIVVARKSPDEPLAAESQSIPKGPKSILLDLALAAAGFGVLIFGSRLMVDEAVKIAHKLNVSEALIGLTIVGVGTSLPELAVTVVAAIRKQTDIAIGNILGSSTFNIIIMGLCGVLVPFAAPDITIWDLAFMFGSSVLLLPFFWHRFTLDRWEGAILFAIYIGYLAHLWPK